MYLRVIVWQRWGLILGYLAITELKAGLGRQSQGGGNRELPVYILRAPSMVGDITL